MATARRSDDLSLWLIRADLAFVASTIVTGPWPAILMLPHGVLVGYEATNFLAKNSPGFIPPDWDPAVASAARHRAKMLDDSRRSAMEQAANFEPIATELERYFRRGARRSIARLLGFRNADASVLFLDDRPVGFSLGLAYSCGWTSESASMDDLGLVVRDLGQGLGQLVAELDIDPMEHVRTVPGYREMDAVVQKLVPASCGGCASLPVAGALLMLLCQSNFALALSSEPRCCDECDAAILKQRFLIAYQVLRSIDGLDATGELLNLRCRERLADARRSQTVTRLMSWRSLRNGLTHYGLNDLSPEALEAGDPLSCIVHGYLGDLTPEDVVLITDAALRLVSEALSSVVDAPPPGGNAWRSHAFTPE